MLHECRTLCTAKISYVVLFEVEQFKFVFHVYLQETFICFEYKENNGTAIAQAYVNTYRTIKA